MPADSHSDILPLWFSIPLRDVDTRLCRREVITRWVVILHGVIRKGVGVWYNCRKISKLGKAILF